MIEIVSVSNNLIKETSKLSQKKYRAESGLFLIEGAKAVEEAFLLGCKFKNIFVLKDKWNKYSDIFSFFDEIILINEAVMAKISTTDTIPEIIASAFQISYDVADFKNMKKIVMLDGVKDSGNLGTILRTCSAFGVDGIILTGDCVDIYNPKTVRSAVGNLFKVPFIEIKDFDIVKKELPEHKFYASVLADDSISIKRVKIADKSVLIFGSEADGISEKVIVSADVKFIIPMSANVESLNVAIASAIAIWEFYSA